MKLRSQAIQELKEAERLKQVAALGDQAQRSAEPEAAIAREDEFELKPPAMTTNAIRALSTKCSECGGPQYETTAGVTCGKGHGGADAKEGLAVALEDEVELKAIEERKDEKAVPWEDVKKRLDLEPKVGDGPPWCPRCGYGYEGTKYEAAAKLSVSLNASLVCTSCQANIVPVLEKPDPDAVRAPGIPKGIRGIVESVFEIDFQKEWKRLHKDLTLGEERTDYGHVVTALDRAEDNARVAHQLYICIRVEYDRYKIDSEVVESGMRSEANARLQSEKESKARAKTITEADIRGEMARCFPDEFRTVEIERSRFRGTVDQAEQLFKRWANRSFALQAILTTMRR